MGAYRVDIRINFAPSRSGRSPGGATDINGVLTFRDEMYMDFVSDIGFTRLPFPCLYDVRGSRIETQCSGYRFTFRMDNEGRIRVDIQRNERRGNEVLRGTGTGYLVKM